MKQKLLLLFLGLFIIGTFVSIGIILARGKSRNPAVAFFEKVYPKETVTKFKCAPHGHNDQTDASAILCESANGEIVYCNSGGTQGKPYCELNAVVAGSDAAKAIAEEQKKEAEAKAAAQKAADEAKAKADVAKDSKKSK